jgi:hypothetical protein
MTTSIFLSPFCSFRRSLERKLGLGFGAQQGRRDGNGANCSENFVMVQQLWILLSEQ